MIRLYITGGYVGNKDRYMKRVSPYFESRAKLLEYQNAYRTLSLSIAEGITKKCRITTNQTHSKIEYI